MPARPVAAGAPGSCALHAGWFRSGRSCPVAPSARCRASRRSRRRHSRRGSVAAIPASARRRRSGCARHRTSPGSGRFPRSAASAADAGIPARCGRGSGRGRRGGERWPGRWRRLLPGRTPPLPGRRSACWPAPGSGRCASAARSRAGRRCGAGSGWPGRAPRPGSGWPASPCRPAPRIRRSVGAPRPGPGRCRPGCARRGAPAGSSAGRTGDSRASSGRPARSPGRGRAWPGRGRVRRRAAGGNGKSGAGPRLPNSADRRWVS